MRILSIDPSVTNIGIIVFDTETKAPENIVLSETMVFKPKDKSNFIEEQFKLGLIPVAKIDKDTEESIKELAKNMWTNRRLFLFYTFLFKLLEESSITIDFVVSESQLHMDTIKCTGVLGAIAGAYNIPYKDYRPKSWKKKFTNNGDIPELALTNLVHNILENPVTRYMSEHEIDCFGIMFAFMNENKIPCKHIRTDLFAKEITYLRPMKKPVKKSKTSARVVKKVTKK